MRPPKVFICYAKQDMTKASELYDRLLAAGADPWFDKQKLELGDDWEQEIKKAVTEADAFVACLRQGFNDIGFRQKEVRWALDAWKLRPPGRGFIIPFLVEPCELPPWCEPLHAGADLTKPSSFEDLLRAIEKHCQVSLKGAEPSPEANAPAWPSRLASILIQILITVEEFPQRSSAGHWVTWLRTQCQLSADHLRDLVLDELEDNDAVAARVKPLVDQCDDVLLSLQAVDSGTYKETVQQLEGVQRTAMQLKREMIDPLPLSQKDLNEVQEVIKKAARKASDLAIRMEKFGGLDFDELEFEASSIGEQVLRLTYYRLDFLSGEQSQALQNAAKELHLVETIELQSDGGASFKAVVDTITNAARTFQTIGASW